ncbi:unnamed protein product [Discula destructiva]
MASPPNGLEPDDVMPIAIVGMACRFPGDGEDVESLFDMLKRGDNAWSEFPDDRVNIDGFYHPSGSRQGSIGFRGAHFLKNNIKAFDAAFFNISPTEAPAIDPQQRILLETTFQALENAGYSKESLDLSETSVNVGTFVKDYEQVVLRDSDWAPQYAATGTGAAILANRISYQFNLRGPSQTIDTGCSASLVGVHNGCQDLRTGRASLAIAAGVGMILTPATMMPMTALNFLGKEGKCFTFTDKAEGYGRGEGVGVVILKRLDDALRDNDSIRAVIRGSRVNQDGRTPGITMPSAEAQLNNIRAVYAEAGLSVDQTAYVECHGTGTPAGDPKESFAVSQAFCGERDAEKPILIGSLKPNIGHLEGAAGVAGLIKATMAVERGMVPKNLYFDKSIANKNIKFEEWKVKVPTELTPWPLEGLRRASVNCFGFGGTNAHIILDDAASYSAQRGLLANHHSAPTSVVVAGPKQKTFAKVQVFLISSHERDGISRITKGHAPFIADHAPDADLLANYAYTLSRRSRMEFKACIVAASTQELAVKLADTAALSIQRCAEDASTPKLAMIFCGQGAQWHAMGRELMEYEPFANSLVGASKYLSKIVGSEFDLLQELRHEDPALSRIDEPKFAQPATTAVQVALVDLCKASNISPHAVVGHSSGEIAAAYAAGHITREDAWLIAFRRGQHASMVSMRSPHLKGGMMAVGLSCTDAEEYIRKAVSMGDGQGTLGVACENSPVSVTLSGDRDQLARVAALLEIDDVFHRVLKVQTAYHSSHMRMIEQEYRQSLNGIVPMLNPEGPKMFSSVTGQLVDGSALDGSYWAENLVSPALFNQAFSSMYSAVKPKLVLEVSPSATLNRPVQEIIQAVKSTQKKDLVCVPLLKRGMNASVTALEALGNIWSRGVPADLSWTWKSKEGILPQLVVDLPPYPFNHTKSYWFESHLGTALRFRKHGREDMIGAPLAESTPQEPRWRGFFRLGENPWLVDHQVQKTTIYPAAGLLTMALEAARQCSDTALMVDTYQISNFTIFKPVIIPAGEHGLEHCINAKIIQVPSPENSHCSSVWSWSILTKTENGQWQENAEGQFTIFYRGKATDRVQEPTTKGEEYQNKYAKLRTECTQVINPRALYERLDGIGMNYGPSFQNIVGLSKSQDACTSVVRIPDTKSGMPAQYEYDHLIHPATLDAMFQTVFAVGDTSMVPSFIRQITLSPDMLRGAGAEFHGYATAQLKGYREAEADIIMSDKSFSKPMVAIKGMRFVKISSDASGFLPSDRNLCSEMVFKELGCVPPIVDGATNLAGLGPIVLLVPDNAHEKTMDIVARLGASSANTKCIRLSELDASHMSELCISFLEFEQPFMFDVAPQDFAKIQMLIKLTAGLLWLTFGGKGAEENPQMAPFQGLARSIRSEDSSRRIVTLDLKQHSYTDLQGVQMEMSAIRSVFTTTFCSSDLDESTEYSEAEYSFRDGHLWGPRLSPIRDLNAAIENGKDSLVDLKAVAIEDANGPLEFKVGKIGDVSSAYFEAQESHSKPLGPNDVRISIESTHLFPIDYETVMGRSSEADLGVDVIGQVKETGVNVADLPCGSLVVALARNTIRTSITLDRSVVHKVRDRAALHGLSPAALTTAYHGLVSVGGLVSGDTVFVNHAAGPYGDAVLRLCKALGLKAFAGCLTLEERDFIHNNYDVPLDHMVDTNNERFPDEVLRLTAGSGVDFFFSPSPDHLEASAQCVATNGHLFLVMNTNAPLSKNAVIPQHANMSFHKFDLFGLMQKRAQICARAWAQVFELVISGQLPKGPDSLIYEERVHHLDQLWDNMSARPGRHLNKVTFTDNSKVRIGKNRIMPISLEPSAAYVLVGGLGGLGKAVATLMVDRGARCLVFLSRSGASTKDDQEFLSSLEQRGVSVQALRVDICDKNDLQRTLSNSGLPVIQGVVQCAAVISDSIFELMTHAEWTAATRPKMLGSLNLHQVLPDNMDFFVMLSSASGIIGNRGQGNYAAGNVFQDALARFRTKNSQPSYSIDLGPVMGAGMLENDAETCAILKSSGFFMVMLENFLFIVERTMSSSTCNIHIPAQIITGVGTGGLIAQNAVSDPFWAETKMFEILNSIDEPSLPSDNPSTTGGSFNSLSSQGSGRGLLQSLKQVESAEEAGAIVARGCVNYLSVSLSMDPADMDADKSLTAYGVDSLVTSSFRSWIFKNLGVKITDMEVIGAASIAELAWSIAEKGGWGL